VLRDRCQEEAVHKCISFERYLLVALESEYAAGQVHLLVLAE
jgi:hypothetical protein